MASDARHLLTLEALYQLPDDGLKYGLSKGRLISEPPPGWLHGVVAANLVCALRNYARDRGDIVLTCDAWFVLARTPDTVRGPDVAYVTRERAEQHAEKSKPFVGAPDLAVEVLSPSDRDASVLHKTGEFLDAGASAVWLVDPLSQTVRICTANKTTMLGIEQTVTHAELLPGFTLPLREIFHS